MLQDPSPQQAEQAGPDRKAVSPAQAGAAYQAAQPRPEASAEPEALAEPLTQEGFADRFREVL